MWTISAQSLNHWSALQEESDTLFTTQDWEILSILKELENNDEIENSSNKSRLTGYFCSDTIFNLSKRKREKNKTDAPYQLTTPFLYPSQRSHQEEPQQPVSAPTPRLHSAMVGFLHCGDVFWVTANWCLNITSFQARCYHLTSTKWIMIPCQLFSLFLSCCSQNVFRLN